MHKYWMALMVATTALLSTIPAMAAVPVWRFDAQQNRLDLQFDTPVQPQARLVSNPTRLVIDLPGLTLGQKSFTTPLTGEAVRSIRFGQFESGTTRVVVELASGYQIDPQQVRFQALSPQHWTIELPPPAITPVNPVAASNDIAIAVPTLPPELLPPPIPQRHPGKMLVVLDPGHGGPDPGAIGIGGIEEKNIVLDIAEKLAVQLRSRGIDVILTRDTDLDLDLPPRVALAERVKADLFVSIHANSIDLNHPDVNGLQTYYFHDNSSNLAQLIHQEVLHTTGIHDRSVRTARFYVIRNTSMPAVLVEVGFVTGQEDAAHLSDASYREKTAEAIAAGILHLKHESPVINDRPSIHVGG
jgi:N-acetylmuramoyl-L-alanine amidase